ncbi:helix-turn-helix transcriptional regulator [Pontibacterium sp. N1Y112]|uniref:Helix-turn-helix transcriptional regulator n=1 Tax=Pontibacterium sinense TaxID=2781979 RepID=A0A8J7JWW5_9GAMM|nr:helix-turn-helix transcriptional regulator [Pontibacterium sinense]MBE9395688.1 helix-turn-helix transcriptional regulator [Pontibacterium sinense]
MLDQKQLAILDRLYKCILNPEGWGDLIECIKDDVGAYGTNIFVGDRIFFELQNSWLTQDIQAKFPAFAEQGFIQREIPVNETAIKIVPQPKFILMTEIEDAHNRISDNKVDNREVHDWLYANEGIRHRYVTPMNYHPTHFDSICISYRDGSQAAIEQGVSRGNSYLPHLANLINVSRPFLLLKARFNGVMEVLDRFRLGVFLLTLDGTLVEQNEAARNILDAKDAIRLGQKHRLTLSDMDKQRELQHVIKQMASTEQGAKGALQHRMQIPRAADQRDLLLEVAPLLHKDLPIGAIVIAIDPDTKALINTSHFGELFSLTDAEQSVCQLLLEGHKSGDIADMRSTRVDTVRSQVKSILTKTETYQQTELIRLALSINIPVDK